MSEKDARSTYYSDIKLNLETVIQMVHPISTNL